MATVDKDISSVFGPPYLPLSISMTANRNYCYRSKADKTITNTPIRYRNAQKN